MRQSSDSELVPEGKRRNIAVIGLSYPFRGGISHYTTLLVRELRKKHDVTFITFRRQYPGFLFPGKTQYDFSAKTLVEHNEQIIDSLNPFTWMKVARKLNRELPELVIFQWWHPFFAPPFGTIYRLLKPGLRRRVCFLCHNVLPHESNPLQTAMTRYAFGKSPFFIVHSEQDRRQLQELRQSALIRKGCHPTYSEFGEWQSFSKQEARRLLAIPEGRNVILYFGLVRRYKGLKYLIEAMKLILERMDCELLIVGEFYDDKQQYLDLIEREGVTSHVRVIDRYIPNEDVAPYFNCADVVVLPYTSATQSGIVQIAFGLGTPVITTNVGGLPEAVDDGRTGFVVEALSPENLAEAVVRYYNGNFETKFRAEIERQIDRFDWDEEINYIEEFLTLAEAG